jgi:hypothetical protein
MEADKDIKAILPSDAEETYRFTPSGKIPDAKGVVVRKYNSSGNNIPRLSARFKGDTDELISNGNAKEVARKINELFIVNKKIKISLHGSTSAPKEKGNNTNRDDGTNYDYSIDGEEKEGATLNDLLEARAKAGRQLLIESGVDLGRRRLIVSESNIFEGIKGVESRIVRN